MGRARTEPHTGKLPRRRASGWGPSNVLWDGGAPDAAAPGPHRSRPATGAAHASCAVRRQRDSVTLSRGIAAQTDRRRVNSLGSSARGATRRFTGLPAMRAAWSANWPRLVVQAATGMSRVVVLIGLAAGSRAEQDQADGGRRDRGDGFSQPRDNGLS